MAASKPTFIRDSFKNKYLSISGAKDSFPIELRSYNHNSLYILYLFIIYIPLKGIL